MDAASKMNGLVLLLFCIATSGGAASNSTSESYPEPEEISDAIPVAITILVILILLLLIFIIILLLVCIRLLAKSTRSKDFEHNETSRSYTFQTSQQHSQAPAQRMEPIGRQHQQQQQQHAPVAYVSNQSHPMSSDPKTYSVPGHVCMCNECKDIRNQCSVN